VCRKTRQEVNRSILRGFSPVSVGGVDQSIRIKVGGDLHELGKLGKLVSAKKAKYWSDLFEYNYPACSNKHEDERFRRRIYSDGNADRRRHSSVAFYHDVFGATVLREGEPTLLRLKNIWITINRGGGGIDDKPEVIASPPKDLNTLSSFINLRVVDIKRCYEIWRSPGAQFITEPKIHQTEMRCYMRDPDGYLIEVGQTTMTATPLELYR
jgi:hypothetical protein